MISVEPDPSPVDTRLIPRALASCGFLYCLGMPYHQALRLFSTSVLLIGWKDMILLFSLLLVGLMALGRKVSPAWRVLSLLIISLVVLLLADSICQFQLPLVLEAVLLMLGSVSSGYFIYHEILYFRHAGRLSRMMKIMLFSVMVISLWMLVENPLGLTIKPPDADQNTPTYERLDLTRAHASFDCPMSAGQWLWFFSILSLGFAMSGRGVALRASLFLVFLTSLGAIFISLSRGPLVLEALSLALFVPVHTLLDFRKRFAGVLLITVLAILVAIPLLLFSAGGSSDAFVDLVTSIGDSSESSNAEREARWGEGIKVIQNTFPWGRGIEYLNEKTLVGTGEIFENTWICLTSSIGLIGFLYASSYGLGILWCALRAVRGALASGSRETLDYLPIFLTLPWLVYMLQFPILTARFGSMIAWLIFGTNLALMSLKKNFSSTIAS